MAKISTRLMSVCAAAVTAVYAAGYIVTMPSAQANTSSMPDLGGTTPSQSTPSAAAKAFASHPPSTGSTNAVARHPHHARPKGGTGATGNSVAKAASASASASAKKPATTSRGTAAKIAKAKVAQYRDGVYTGVGSNPYGSLALSVAIRGGKIASVTINQYSMHYPQSVIDPQLPQEAVSMQTWRIYIVSGATASTYNFAEALYQALQKAKA